MSAGRIVLLIFGVIVVLLSASLGFAGGTLAWLDRTRVDNQGFFASSPMHVERDSFAVVLGPIEVDEVAVEVLNWMGLAKTFAVQAASRDSEKRLFLGVAQESDLMAYLSGIRYDEADIDGWPSLRRLVYSDHPGILEPAAPATKSFWSGFAQGIGTQVLEWETRVGSHYVVLMNENGSAGLDLNATFKVKVHGMLLAIGTGLLVIGVIGTLGGCLMIFLAVRKRDSSATPEKAPANPAGNS